MSRALPILALLVGCAPQPDAAETPDDEPRDEWVPPEPQTELVGHVRGPAGEGVPAVVLACLDVCITGASDAADGAYSLDGTLGPGDWWIHITPTDDTLMSWSLPVTIAEGQASAQVDAQVVPVVGGVPFGEDPQELELAPGLFVTLGVASLVGGVADERIARAVPLDIDGLPADLLPPGEVVAAWTLDPHGAEVAASAAVPFRIEPGWPVEPGDAFSAWSVGYGWVEAGAGPTDQGQIVGDDLHYVSTLVVVRR